MDSDGTSGIREASSLSAIESWPDSEMHERKHPPLTEHFANRQLSVADEQKQPQPHLRSDIRGGTRSLVGGFFPVSDTCEEDIISVDSASLFGTSFAASLGDHSVATRSSIAMEYSEDERSERGNRSAAPLLTNSLLGDVRNASADSSRYSHFLVDREFDADAHSVLTASTDQASLFADDTTTTSGGDAYFSQHLITPPRSLLRMNRPLNRSVDEEDDENYATDDDDDHDHYLDFDARWILESSDTDHVYEDEDESSNNFSPEPLVDDDESTIHGSLECSNKYHVLEERLQAAQGATTKAPTSTAPVLDWSAYNQERGRFLAHQLISKARQQRHPNDTTTSPHTPSTLASAATPDDGDNDDDDDDEDARRNRALTMFRNPFVRRRRFRNPASTTNKPLDATYVVVDATIRDEALATTQTNAAADLEGTLSPLSSSSATRASSPLNMHRVVLEDDVSRASSLSDSLKDDDDDDDEDDKIADANDNAEGDLVDSSNLECSVSFHHPLPEGLQRRATVEDIIDQLGLGSQGWLAIQQLRDLQGQEQLLPKSMSCCNDKTCPTIVSSLSLSCKDPTTVAMAPPSCRISIQGHSIPNYQARIQWSVSNYRRHVLDLSDELYSAMLQEEEKGSSSPAADPSWPVLLQTS